MRRRITYVVVITVGALSGLSTLAGILPGVPRLPTTLDDFFQPGSQPSNPDSVEYDFFRASNQCMLCHATSPFLGEDLPILPPWQGSMMGQAARDPLFFACLAIVNQDAAFAGDLCLRCHTPGAWIDGRSEPTDGTRLGEEPIDFDGVSCTICHRMVDPVFKPGISPPVDADILANIDPLPINPGGGNFIFDPFDRRRGPYSDPASPTHEWLESQFIRSSELCATCHDVSNPVFQRQSDGTYALTELVAPHPTGDKYDMFPLERTYSEWLESDFAKGEIDMQGRFGGTKRDVSTCQDCHMPTLTGRGCGLDPAVIPERTDLKSHDFSGGNTWVQEMVLNLYPDDGLNPAYLQAGMDRSRSMLQRASTLEVTQVGNHVNVRIINETGHKLPTGYPEGRRMWIHVTVYDDSLVTLVEFGHYDALGANLTTGDTRVFEVHHGADAAVAAAAGIDEGPGFHFALNNVIFKDNRIPPRGFTFASFRDVQAEPVGTTYLDGQYWSDTQYRLPDGAASATVELFYQTSSKEFIEFLLYENVTDLSGEILFEQWELTGKSPPVLMAEMSIQLAPFPDGDSSGDGNIDLDDYWDFAATCLLGPDVPYDDPICAALDSDDDGDVDMFDYREFALEFME